MSTRSRTRAAVASLNAQEIVSVLPPPLVTRSRRDAETNLPQQKRSTKPAARRKAKEKSSKLSTKAKLCMCTKGDDGSPMVQCAECNIWYHFSCVNLTEEEAEEINAYICPPCSETTGLHTAMLWEGPGAIEEVSQNDDAVTPKSGSKKGPSKSRLAEPMDRMDESDDWEEASSSQDEYVIDAETNMEQRPKPASSVSDSDDVRSLKRTSHPPPSATSDDPVKRKSSTSDAHTKKRNLSTSPTDNPDDDPARKYCLLKLQELFKDVFLRYPHVVVKGEREGDKEGKTQIIHRSLEDMTEEDKEALVEESKHFAMQLEQSVYDIYSEKDKLGISHSGGSYKDRFRMLHFNLSKPDRVVIHQRITSANISAREIALMSSTDLADEETKQSIMIAEKEALEHSILQKAPLPRAKITHKGLQDIESVNGETSRSYEPETERVRELVAEERREAERMARLRTVQRQRTMSVSVPPESPVPSSAPNDWGAPPPVPANASSPTSDDRRTSVNMSLPNIAEPHELELNLADLINIDDESMGQNVSALVASSPVNAASMSSNNSDPLQSLPLPTGISPFAARTEEERPNPFSFDLDSLWNASKQEMSTTPISSPPPAESSANISSLVINQTPNTGEMVEETKDQDFDMFLQEKEQESPMTVSAETPQEAFTGSPPVWNGKICMPLDSSVTQETPLVARQMGGKPIDPSSVLWKVLFTSDLLRIDGRVPVEKSSKFLLQTRMNISRELIGVAFTPATAEGANDFKTLSTFLISKGRHGLIFPWGPRPKEHHPGRELYIIPLLSTDPLPDYMELLDNLKLPAKRTVDYLVGIWILNKGKLASAHIPAPAVPSVPYISSLPTIPTFPMSLHAPLFQTPMMQQQTASGSHESPPLNVHAYGHPPAPAPPGMPTLPVPAAALAAEVAALTPDQIQNLMRAIASSSALSSVLSPPSRAHAQLPQLPLQGMPHLPLPLPQHALPSQQIPMAQQMLSSHQMHPAHHMPPTQHMPQQMHVPLPAAPLTQLWPSAQPPGYASPRNQSSQLPEHRSPRPPNQTPYERRSRHGGRHGQGHERGQRGERGERGDRNRDRPGRTGRGNRRGKEGAPLLTGPIDSGWPRRIPRNEGMGGTGASDSPHW